MRNGSLCGIALAASLIVGCSNTEVTGPNAPANQVALQDEAQLALKRMEAQDPGLRNTLHNAYAYIVIPEVGNAAVGVGGASGRGVVYRNGQPVGTVEMNQVSVGPLVAGETYAELIVLQNEPAYQRLINGALEFGAHASATVVKAGAAGATPFDDGVAVFVLPKGGLSVGLSLDGQKLRFHPNNRI